MNSITTATAVGISLTELVTVAVAIIGALWALGKIALSQFKAILDQRFQTIDAKLATFDPLHGELVRVDKDLVQVRLEMATNFVRQDGIRQLTVRMEQLFKEIFDKLDTKADKSECAIHHSGRCEQ
jgi:F0F1-type ATP synthase membrane subunit b/b'